MQKEIKSEDFYADACLDVLGKAIIAVTKSEDVKIWPHELDAIVSKAIEGDARWQVVRDGHDVPLYKVLTRRVTDTLLNAELLWELEQGAQ